MLRTISILSLIILVHQSIQAQVAPKPGATLNYRLIGFSVPQEERVINYTLEIAAGNYDAESTFERNIISRQQSEKNKIIAEVPSFGGQYTWRVIYTRDKSDKTTSNLFHFSTGIIPEVDTNNIRLKITKQAAAFKDAYVFLDDTKTLYDMNGNPVWYLPQIEGRSITPRNIKVSRYGTITFIFDPPYEINYNGDILWKPPPVATVSGDNSEHFHHQFTHLTNGHYMVLGEDSVMCRLSSKSKINNSGNVTEYGITRKIQFGTIIEYDAEGNVTWSWKSSDYFTRSDLNLFAQPVGDPDTDVHENSFHFDEKNKVIYVSFKNASLILKVNYPEGKVIAAYGEQKKTGNGGKSYNLFCGQHSLKLTHDGNLLLFNNNSCQPGACPKVEILQEPISENDTMKTLWEYECATNLKFSCGFPSGGNVIELSDRSIFVSTAAPDSKVFIVNRDKEILWCALPQRWNAPASRWDPMPDYRASIIQNRKDLERLIWNAERVDKKGIATPIDDAFVKPDAPKIKQLSGTP